MDFLLLQMISCLEGHPMILGRAWLAMFNAYMRCRSGNMIISHVYLTRNLILYQPTKCSMTCENYLWDKYKFED